MNEPVTEQMAEEAAAHTAQRADAGPPRVGIVLVSHSGEVADSVARLASGLADTGSAPVTGAGGAADGGLGISAELITRAARKVDRGLGVAILVDLGGAVPTVQAMLAEGDELPEVTRLLDAPLVEGAVVAVATASGGADLDTVAAAAEGYDHRKV